MIVYRIAHTRYIQDLSGTGARLFGGRWNQKGTFVVYAATSRALAMVEYLVHLPLSLLPSGLSIAMIDIPDQASIQEVALTELPSNWRTYPTPSRLASLGTQWAMSLTTLLLRVPSVVVEHEWNILLNPIHPEMAQVKVAQVAPYEFDPRLLRQ